MKQKVKALKAIPVVVRMPRKMVAALDKAAQENGRSRSKEVLVRVQGTLAGSNA